MTISGVTGPATLWYGGPFKSSGGNFYLIALSSTDATIVKAMKASDPTQDANWSNVGTNPDLVNSVQSLYCAQVGDVLHVATIEGTTGRVAYHTFSMSSDSWTLTNEQVTAGLTPVAANNQMGVSIGVRNTGDVIVLYKSRTIQIHWARRVSGVWTADLLFDSVVGNLGEEIFAGPMLAEPGGNRMLVAYRVDVESGA